MATINDFLKTAGRTAGNILTYSNPLSASVAGGFNVLNNMSKKKTPTVSNATSGATQPTPPRAPVSSAQVQTNQNPFLPSTAQPNQNMQRTQLPQAGEQFVSNLINERTAQPSPIVQQPTTAITPQQAQVDPYTEYIQSLTSKDFRTAAEKAQTDAQRLADIQSEREVFETDSRRQYEDILDESGGLRSGAVTSAKQYSRRSNQELADIALQESATARSAGVSSNFLQNLLTAGKEARPETSEGFTLGKDQVRYDAQGNVIARGGGGGDTTGIDNPEVTAFAQAINSGQAKLSDIPQDLRGAVLEQVNQTQGQTITPAQEASIQRANIALDIFNDIFDEEGNIKVEGALARKTFGLIPGSKARDLNESVASIKAMIGFDELQAMRDASPTGGALGQVSEREIDFLQALRGSLDVGQSDEQLESNLRDIQKSFQTLRLTSSPDGTTGIIDELEFTKQGDNLITDVPGKGLQKINPSGDPPLIPFEGFNTVGSDTNIASKVADAIMTVESGGKQVKGASGEFGAFQFMPATWQTISRQVAGQVLPQTPQNERAVAEAKIGQLLAQEYSPQEVALIWNTSLGGAEKPFVRKGTNSKGVAYDSGAYAQKVVNTLNKLT